MPVHEERSTACPSYGKMKLGGAGAKGVAGGDGGTGGAAGTATRAWMAAAN